jgi:hypothetical protein
MTRRARCSHGLSATHCRTRPLGTEPEFLATECRGTPFATRSRQALAASSTPLVLETTATPNAQYTPNLTRLRQAEGAFPIGS